MHVGLARAQHLASLMGPLPLPPHHLPPLTDTPTPLVHLSFAGTFVARA